MTDTETLEAMIDKHGLVYVLAGLELVCGEKATFARLETQNNAAVRAWEAAAKKIGTVAREITT